MEDPGSGRVNEELSQSHIPSISLPAIPSFCFFFKLLYFHVRSAAKKKKSHVGVVMRCDVGFICWGLTQLREMLNRLV